MALITILAFGLFPREKWMTTRTWGPHLHNKLRSPRIACDATDKYQVPGRGLLPTYSAHPSGDSVFQPST